MGYSILFLAIATQAIAAQPSVSTTSQIVASRPSSAEVLTDETIITLVKAGLGPETLVAKIGASKGSFDTSTDALIRLRQANVPDAVIAAMLNNAKSAVAGNGVADNSNPDPLVPHSPGIYLLDTSGPHRTVRIDATASNQVKTSNYWGFALTAGLSSMKKKLVVPNATARVHSPDRRPIFYFYFGRPEALADIADFNSNLAVSAMSPNEFSLVRLEQKKDHREAAVASINIISRMKTGVSDKARIAFTYDDIAPGVFRVTPSIDLEPGEYGFVSSVSASADKDVIARIFDFSVS